MAKYTATVERGERFWIVRVPGVGTTQARHLRELETMTLDLIAVMEEVEPDTVDVVYDIHMPADARSHLAAAEKLRAQAQDAQARAAAEVRTAANLLRATGMPLRDVGKLLGVSYQRAHQLTDS